MAIVATYLNFPGTTEEAFNYYSQVFGTVIIGIMRHGDVPLPEGTPALSEEDARMVINVQLPILGGHLLMGTDIPASMGMPLHAGNNVHICLMPDTREEADRLFAALSPDGSVTMPMAEQFWGDYYGAFSDRFGIHWMINHTPTS